MLELTDYSDYLSQKIILHKVFSCTAGRIFYFYAGRNAWNWTWVQKYPGSTAFNFTLDEAKVKIEQQRVQGSTWWIEELPAFLLSGKEYSLLITEINTDKPLSNYTNAEIKGLSIRDIANSFTPIKPDSVVRLICSSELKMDTSNKALKRYKSISEGGGYRLYWSQRDDSQYIPKSIQLIAKRFEEKFR